MGHRMQIVERGFGFAPDEIRRKYIIPLDPAPTSSVLLEIVYFEGLFFFVFYLRENYPNPK